MKIMGKKAFRINFKHQSFRACALANAVCSACPRQHSPHTQQAAPAAAPPGRRRRPRRACGRWRHRPARAAAPPPRPPRAASTRPARPWAGTRGLVTTETMERKKLMKPDTGTTPDSELTCAASASRSPRSSSRRAFSVACSRSSHPCRRSFQTWPGSLRLICCRNSDLRGAES